MKIFENIEMVRVFGSRTRGDYDEFSDFDIIVVYEESNTLNRKEIKKFMEEKFNSDVSISWYSKTKLDNYFQGGNLFAWHLYLESENIEGLPDNYLKPFFKPNEYKNYKADVLSLIRIIDSIITALERDENNIIYEAGLLYVCCRNIAMSASVKLGDKLEFGRYSPFNLTKSKNIFPISKEDYRILIDSRLASMRSAQPKKLEHKHILQLAKSAKFWAKKISLELK